MTHLPASPRRPVPSGRTFFRHALVAWALLAWAVPAWPGALAAQEPPVPARRDTVPAVAAPAPDTLPVDSTGVAQDAQADSVSADTIFYNLPRMDAAEAAGWARGVWTWDREDILSTGALTLAELVDEVPGLITLLSGDYGTPTGISAFGLGGGRIRILRDGFEVLPLEGGVADLARVPLTGIDRVRLERFPGELVVRLEGLEYDDGRPYSLIEAGTGDLNTNQFRGTFANPTAMGGSVAVGLERADSRGARGDAAGNVTGTWLRYQLHRGDQAGVAVDFRRVGSESEVDLYASPVTRTDWTVRGRAALVPGLNAEAYWGKSTHKVEDIRDAYAREGGSRSQLGVRLAAERDGFFAQGAYRHFGGDGLPSSRVDLTAGADLPQVGGFAASVDRASWPGETTSAKRVRGWTRPVLGFSVFGSWEKGTYGSRTFPLLGPDTTSAAEEPVDPGTEEPVDPDPEVVEDPLFRVTDRTATRYGAMWAWRDIALSGARLKVEADSLLPLGIEPDRGEPALAGGTRNGWEIWGRVPMPLNGLHFEGSLQQWEQDWSYLARRTYTGAFVFHRQYLESGNLEWWWTLGVKGHDAMSVRQVVGEELNEDDEVVGPELATVPFYQNWYARIQLRIVSVRIFIGWENFTVRRDLQNYPDRLLPITRTFYGIRWTMWN